MLDSVWVIHTFEFGWSIRPVSDHRLLNNSTGVDSSKQTSNQLLRVCIWTSANLGSVSLFRYTQVVTAMEWMARYGSCVDIMTKFGWVHTVQPLYSPQILPSWPLQRTRQRMLVPGPEQSCRANYIDTEGEKRLMDIPLLFAYYVGY